MSGTCRVSFTDGADGTPTITLSASSLYEAVLGIAEFGRSGFAFGTISPATLIRVLVEPPAVAHELSVAKFQALLDGNGETPYEQAKKVTLRRLFGRG